jgi:hypothetical protein
VAAAPAALEALCVCVCVCVCVRARAEVEVEEVEEQVVVVVVVVTHGIREKKRQTRPECISTQAMRAILQECQLTRCPVRAWPWTLSTRQHRDQNRQGHRKSPRFLHPCEVAVVVVVV